MIIKKQKRPCSIEDFAVQADKRMKIKRKGKEDKYLDHARDLGKLWNMKVMVISIVVTELGTFPEGFERGQVKLEFGGGIETIEIYNQQ